MGRWISSPILGPSTLLVVLLSMYCLVYQASYFVCSLGRRRGYGRMPMLPHHLPMTVLGGAMLWFGWFGFNAGSALGAGPFGANAVLTTQMSAAIGIVGWVLVERYHRGKPTVLGAVSGGVSGLVAITPAAGFVTPVAPYQSVSYRCHLLLCSGRCVKEQVWL